MAVIEYQQKWFQANVPPMLRTADKKYSLTIMMFCVTVQLYGFQCIQEAEQCHHSLWPPERRPTVNPCTSDVLIIMAVWLLEKCRFHMAHYTFHSMDKKFQSILKLKFWLNLKQTPTKFIQLGYQLTEKNILNLLSLSFSYFV